MSYPDDDWDDADDESDTVPCRSCGEDIYEDAVRCPHCGNYLSDEDAPPRRHPWWIVIGALAVLAIVAAWVLAGL
jgi:predicted nucleic acid-binding Zn ribbon protein